MRRLLVVTAALLLSATAGSCGPLKPFLRDSWHTILKAHAGRPTVVHFWAMTCGPCRVEMPRWGTFLATHPGVDVVTIDTDAGDGMPGAAEAFLAEAKMPSDDAWRFADPFTEKLYFAVDPNWQGEIPLTLLIDADGHATRKVGAANWDDIALWFGAHPK